MQILDLGDENRLGERSAVTIGVYDGVHRGHRYLIDQVCRRGRALGCVTGVVTFDCHPASVVRPSSVPKLLTTFEQKLELLEETGVDFVLVIPFDRERAHQSAGEFVSEVLVGRLAVELVVVGDDFHFGRGRQGDVKRLAEMGEAGGFGVVSPPLVEDGGVISSTRIRALLADGDTPTAARLLGRPHEIRGTVVHGDKRGRELGYPTANIAVDRAIQMPADGIYAGWYARGDGSTHVAAINLGRRPTFHDEASESVLEAHLLDFDDDLYGEEARVRFSARLRREERFDSVDALVEQMDADVAGVRARLVGSGGRGTGADP